MGHNPYKGKPESFSKKGYGGFVSKDRRVARTQVPSGPGPGKYGLPSMLQKKSDFNKANTGNFHQPIAQSHNKHEVLPAPTTYNVSIVGFRFLIEFYVHTSPPFSIISKVLLSSHVSQSAQTPNQMKLWHYVINMLYNLLDNIMPQLQPI